MKPVLIIVTSALLLTGCSSAPAPTPVESATAQAAAPITRPSSARTGLTPAPSAAILAEQAATLQAVDDQIRADFATGMSVVGTPAGVDWWTTVDLSNSSIPLSGDAYKKTQAVFGDYDPAAFDDWLHGALLPLSTDLITWYQAPVGSTEQTTGQSKVEADLAAADADIKLVLAGQVSQM
jgi:hypothetical protein